MSDDRTDERAGDGAPEEEVPLAALRDLASHLDGPPPEVVAAAKAAFTWRTIDAELAELAFDSLVAGDALAGVRGGAPRQLTFEADGLTVEVELDLEARPQLHGQVVPPQAADIEVRVPTGVRTVRADELGRFSCSGLASGPLSLRCHPADGRAAVATAWVVI